MSKSAKKTAKKTDALPKRLTLDELSEQTNFAARTIRYYIQQGLLPSPGHGANARYDERHRDRLIFIRKMQRARVSLAEIEQQLASMDDNEVLLKIMASPAFSAEKPESRTKAPPASTEAVTRTQWDRIEIGAHLELHVRRPLSRQDNRRVEQLIEYARSLSLTEKP